MAQLLMEKPIGKRYEELHKWAMHHMVLGYYERNAAGYFGCLYLIVMRNVFSYRELVTSTGARTIVELRCKENIGHVTRPRIKLKSYCGIMSKVYIGSALKSWSFSLDSSNPYSPQQKYFEEPSPPQSPSSCQQLRLELLLLLFNCLRNHNKDDQERHTTV